MKAEIRLSIFGIIITSMMVFACQKQLPGPDIKGSNGNDPVEKGANETGHHKGKPADRYYLHPYGYCSAVPYNCVRLPDIIIVPATRAILIGLEDAPSGEVAAAFNSADLADVANELPDNFIDSLQSGNYYLNISYHSSGLLCFIAGTTRPVTGENMKFAFEVLNEQ